MFVFAVLCLRFHPDVIDVVKEGDFMESYALLDGDRVQFRGANKDIFVAVQPHHIMGSVYSTIGGDSSDVIAHRPGDRFRVRDQDLLLTYSYRGGAVVNTWQIPDNVCKNHNIFSTQQREAVIKVQHFFSEEATICWFLNFRKSVEFSIDFIQGGNGSVVRIADTSVLPGFITVNAPEKLAGSLNKQQLIILEAHPGEIDLSVHVSSPIPFADWTDSPSLFLDRGESKEQNLPLYLITVRDVKMWIWGALLGIVGFILLFTGGILFSRPLRKFGLAVSDIRPVTKARDVKRKRE
jgi:hypothetical protein